MIIIIFVTNQATRFQHAALDATTWIKIPVRAYCKG